MSPTGTRADVATPVAGAPASPSRARRWLAGGLLAAAAVAVGLVVADPFGGAAVPGVQDNGSPVTLATVGRQSLTSQTQVTGTLGYTGASTVLVPRGSSPSAVLAADGSLTAATATLATAESTASADDRAHGLAQSSLAAARRKRAAGCAVPATARTASTATGSAALCAADRQAVSADEQTLSAASARLAGDRSSVAMAETRVAAARSGVAAAQSSATLYGPTSTFTDLPAAGRVIARGQPLYEIDGHPAILLYGRFLASRAFVDGMSNGPDVAELNANLDALAYGHGLTGDVFNAATAAAIRALQSAHGQAATGELPLGSVVFATGAVRVTSVTPVLGQIVSPGPVLALTSAARKVTIELDAAAQSAVRVGDAVTITLPDNQTTPGRVTYVATVAKEPPAGADGGGSSSPTIEVGVSPTDAAATGNLDQAPVNVSITTATVADALVVPVDALLALAGGGYAVEEVPPTGAHRLVGVQLGLFDDADGLVQVTGSGIAAGQRVVVPGQ